MNKEIIKDIITWDAINWTRSFNYLNEKIDIKDKNYNCLEIGARQGGLSLWLAFNGNNVVCSDLSYYDQEQELHKAKALHKKHNCSKKIKYEAINAMEIPYENHFDIVVFKSVLGGIGIYAKKKINTEQKVVDQIFKCLKPGGMVIFIENLEASFLHMYLRKTFVKWGTSWNYLKLKEVLPLFNSFKSFNYNTFGFFGAFGRTEEQRQLFGKIDSVFEKFVPKSKRYIIAAIVEK